LRDGAAGANRCRAARIRRASVTGAVEVNIVSAWLQARRTAREERRRIWRVALAPDPQDPEGLCPLVRLLEREVTSALAAAGFACRRRTVREYTMPVATGSAPTFRDLPLEIEGTELEVWLSSYTSCAGPKGSDALTRIENQGFRTPEAYAAAVVAEALSWARGRVRVEPGSYIRVSPGDWTSPAMRRAVLIFALLGLGLAALMLLAGWR
jgi:hypothetical protein